MSDNQNDDLLENEVLENEQQEEIPDAENSETEIPDDATDTEVDTDVETEVDNETDGEPSFDYLGTAKKLLKITDSASESDIFLLESVCEVTIASVCNYCNISEVPKGLQYTVCMMMCDTYRELQAKASTGGIVGNASSISEGGRSVSFGGLADVQASVDDRITRTRELNRYKRLYRT